jgi:AP-2 complex subunit mu-1
MQDGLGESKVRAFGERYHLEVSPPLLRICIRANVIDRIARIQGGSEATLTAVADLTATTTRQAWARPPIDVDFQVLMLTASGLLVRFLKVYAKEGYHSVKWVRYLTKASGTYQIRVR